MRKRSAPSNTQIGRKKYRRLANPSSDMNFVLNMIRICAQQQVRNRARANLLTGVNALPPEVAAMVQTLQQEIQTLKQQLAEKDELLSRAFDESLSSASFYQPNFEEEDPL